MVRLFTTNKCRDTCPFKLGCILINRSAPVSNTSYTTQMSDVHQSDAPTPEAWAVDQSVSCCIRCLHHAETHINDLTGLLPSPFCHTG